MPKVTNKIPTDIKPYEFHGLNLQWDGHKQWNGDCPFCGRDEKFSVNQDSGLYRCLICATGTKKGGGNSLVFIRKLHEIAMSETTERDYDLLASERGLEVSGLIKWGVCKSPILDDWMVPGYNHEGKMTTLYVKKGKVLYPTPTMGPGIFGGGLYDSSKVVVDLCEGPWDGIALDLAFGEATEYPGFSPQKTYLAFK